MAGAEKPSEAHELSPAARVASLSFAAKFVPRTTTDCHWTVGRGGERRGGSSSHTPRDGPLCHLFPEHPEVRSDGC